MDGSLERRSLNIDKEVFGTFGLGGMSMPGYGTAKPAGGEAEDQEMSGDTVFCTDTDYCSSTGCGGCTATCITCTTCPGSLGTLCPGCSPE